MEYNKILPMITNYQDDHGNSTRELPQRGNVLSEIVSRKESLIICFMQNCWIFVAIQRGQIKIEHRLHSFLQLGIHYKMVMTRFAILRSINSQCSRFQMKLVNKKPKNNCYPQFFKPSFFFFLHHPWDRLFAEEKTDRVFK